MSRPSDSSSFSCSRRSAPAWRPSAAGATRAPRRRSAARSSSSPIDTLRADHLPAYGYTKVKTPAIDALAADGVVFERAYSHAPQTLPAHASILSGQLPFETGVRDNVGFTVKTGERLLPQMLRERGFTTGGIVSAYVLRKETGIGQGFDFFDGEMPPSSPELLDRPGAARRRRVREDRRALARHRSAPRAPSCSCISTSRTSRTRRRTRFAAVRALRRRDRLRRRNRRPPGAVPEVAPALRPLDDRAAVGSRRRARRSRRAGARPVRLRRGDPRAADHQAGRQRRRRPADRRSGAAHRSRADDSRSGEGARRRQPARPLAEAGARRHRQAARRRRSTPRRSTRAITSAGAS